MRINLDVLNAQQQLYATQRDLAQARYGALLDSLQPESGKRHPLEADLDAVNRLLRAAAQLNRRACRRSALADLAQQRGGGALEIERNRHRAAAQLLTRAVSGRVSIS